MGVVVRTGQERVRDAYGADQRYAFFNLYVGRTYFLITFYLREICRKAVGHSRPRTATAINVKAQLAVVLAFPDKLEQVAVR